jgi:DNA-binding SARP family transcriptional activator/tetratricopeptide (TPR) repeat protein
VLPSEQLQVATGPRTRFGILGPVEVFRRRHRIPIPSPKQRVALVTLLLHANRSVSVERLIEHMWHHDQPNDARAALHTHIARLRQTLDDGGGSEPLIHTQEYGYLIEVKSDDLDVALFRDLVSRAEQSVDVATEASLLQDALALWRGPALADVPSESLQRDHADRLAEERLRALERWLELGLLAGRHEQVVVELQGLTAAHPLRERLWAQLMLALYRCGRQAEALQAYHAVASLLCEELGIDPGDELRHLHQSILAGEADLMLVPSKPAVPAITTPAAERPEPADVRPCQLPSDTAAFTGRAGELEALDHLLEVVHDKPSAPVRIGVVTGTAGVGKTALAVHWGHLTRRHFPDGQLYVNLRGFGPDKPMEPAAALESLLHGLNIVPQRIPADLDARSALLRSVLADHRVLMVLDNARDVAQVRPLLPGSDCVVLATSREELRGLSVHDDATHVTLGVFSQQESASLLASLLGSDRTAAEPEATAELGQLCAHLPLALRIAVANLTLDRYQSVADYVAELRQGNQLAALSIDGDEQSAVRGTLDLSYAALPPHAQACFRLLGLVPGGDFTVEATAALRGSTVEEARRQLNRLATAHLIHRYAPGRFRFHDLLRLYAMERLHAEESAHDREEAGQRLYDWYLANTRAAVESSHPHWARLPSARPAGVPMAAFADMESSAAWLAAEHRNLVAAVHHAGASGPRASTWLLTDALRSHFWSSGLSDDWLSCAQTAVAAAREEGDPLGTAAALLALAHAHAYRDRPEANSLYAQALAAADESGWSEGQSSIRNNLAGAYALRGQLEEAARYYIEGIELDEQDGRTAWLGVKHVNLGTLYSQMGRLKSALHHLTQALSLHPDRDGIIATNLGETCRLLGRFDAALEHLCRGLSLLQAVRSRTIEPHCLASLADTHTDLGQYDQARAYARRALESARNVDERLPEALALNALGRVDERVGRNAEAMEHHRRAKEVAGDDHPSARIAALIGLANAARGLRWPGL